MYKGDIHLKMIMLFFLKLYTYNLFYTKLYIFIFILKVKVDAKTKALLDEYKKKKRHELAKKAANDTTAFKFIYEEDEEDEDKKKLNSADADGKVNNKSRTFVLSRMTKYFFYFLEKIR